MKEQLERLIDSVEYNIHLFIKKAKADDFLYAKQLDEVVSSASLIKVPILIAVLEFIERENISLHKEVEIKQHHKVEYSVLTEQDVNKSTLYELLVWMIITSDNTATNVLIDFLGIEQYNAFFRKIGLTRTKLQRKMMDFASLEEGVDSVTTARDMAHLFTRIYKQDLLSLQFSQLALDILSRQRINDGLKRYLIENVKMAHKTGNLDNVSHDVGIVFHEKHDYIIGVMITNVDDADEAKKCIGSISKNVFQYFDRIERGGRTL
ncbi:serine hydrolase [Lysinibacillus sp. PLM2]|nr:serine hydrolase [Lysinibacillus sp. PLM2]